MDTKELKPGQQIGVAKRRRITKASIHTIDKVTPTGQVVIGDKRFNNKGYLIGSQSFLNEEYLIPIEEAQELINQEQQKKIERKKKQEHFKEIATTATQKALEVLNQHGYYSDVDGHWSVMECEIKDILTRYMKNHQPVKK